MADSVTGEEGVCYLCTDDKRAKWLCSECKRLFCAAISACGGKYLLASLGETTKRFICVKCMPKIRKRVSEAKSSASSAESSANPGAQVSSSSSYSEGDEEEEEDSSSDDTTGDVEKTPCIAPVAVAEAVKEDETSTKAARLHRSQTEPPGALRSPGRSHERSVSSAGLDRTSRRPSLARHNTSSDLQMLGGFREAPTSVSPSPGPLTRASRSSTMSQMSASSPSSRPKNPFGSRSMKSRGSRSAGGTSKPTSTSRLGKSSRRKKSMAGPVFDMMKATLEEIMHWQAEKPTMCNLKVPYVIQWLLENILKHQGSSTEGIFRLSITSSQIQEYTLLLSHGNFKFDTTDPHCYAVMLKHFLRELPKPLIPDYEACMRARDADLKSNAGVGLYWKLWDETVPEISKEVILTLVDFLIVMTMPRNVSRTKMSLENYVIVFAPAFLRNPSTDMESILLGQGRETNFVEQLLIFCRDHVRLKVNTPSMEMVEVVETVIEYVDEFGNPCDPPEEGEDVDIVEVIEYVDASSNDSSSEDINVLM